MNAKLKEIHDRIKAFKAENETPPDGYITVDFIPILKILDDLVEEMHSMDEANIRELNIHQVEIEKLHERFS